MLVQNVWWRRVEVEAKLHATMTSPHASLSAQFTPLSLLFLSDAHLNAHPGTHSDLPLFTAGAVEVAQSLLAVMMSAVQERVNQTVDLTRQVCE